MRLNTMPVITRVTEKEIFDQIKQLIARAANSLSPEQFNNLNLVIIKNATASVLVNTIEASDADQLDTNVESALDALDLAKAEGCELAYADKGLIKPVALHMVENDKKWN